MIALLTTSAVAHAQSDGHPPGAISVIRYGADEAFAPLEWRDPKGRAKGFQIDLIRAIAAAEGCDIVVRADAWSTIKADFMSGSINVVSMFDQPARREYADFSEPILVMSSEIYVRAGSKEISSLEELAGHEVIVQAGALSEEEITARGIHATLIRVETEADAIRLLASGKHDCALVTELGGRSAMQRFKLGSSIVSTSPPLLVSDVCLAVRKGDAAMLEVLNSGITSVKSSGAYNAIYDRWLGALERPAISRRRALTLAGWLGLPLLALIAVGSVWTRTLRRRVAVRTAALNTELIERRKVEEELRQSDERFRVALASARIMVSTHDRELRYTWVYNDLVNYPSESLLGKTDAEVLPPDLAAPITSAKQRVLESGRGERLDILMHVCATRPYLELFIEPLRDHDGMIVGLTCAAVDISKLKHAQHQQRELEDRIRRSQRLESLGLLAGGIAHDFNNLLAAIIGNTSLSLVETPDTETNTLLRERLNVVSVAATCAAELTQSLFAYTERNQTDSQAVNLAAIAQEMCRVLATTLPPNISLICTAGDADGVGGTVPDVQGNATQLRQLTMNLVKNAADALDGRSGTIVVSTGTLIADRAMLDSAYLGQEARAGRYVFLDVTDTGSGFDPTDAERIFDPFFSTKPMGRGLGLAVVSGTLRRHEGAIIVSSVPERGSTFRALFPCLPASNADTTPPANAPSGVPPSGSLSASHNGATHPTILVVDDNRSIRDLLSLTLKDAGFVPISLESGSAAVARAQGSTEHFSGAVIDMNMPGLDGMQTLERLRQMHPRIKIVITSGSDSGDTAGRLRHDPDSAFMQKPFAPDDLARTLRILIGG